MPKSFKEILGNDVLNEELQSELNEAFEARIAEERETLTAELREEFASRYENDKTQIVEAMDAMLSEAIRTELEEFAQDKSKVAEDRVRYKKSIKEHAKMLDSFVNEVLSKELRELREDRRSQKVNFGKLEEFVLKQLSKELNEFHDDKRALAEQKVKMIREGRKVIEEAKRNFVKRGAKQLENMVESVMRKELITLREDVQTAKENEFGRKIFETFASEFLTSTLSESTQVAKLAKQIMGLKHKVAESNEAINAKDRAIKEATRKSRIAQDLSERKAIMSEMLGPLNRGQKELMGTLLESVKTSMLKAAYKKYLPSVLSEDVDVKTRAPQTTKANLTENRSNTREITGNKANSGVQQDAGGSADIIKLKKLAGLS
jgi:uncharacterized protein YbcI